MAPPTTAALCAPVAVVLAYLVNDTNRHRRGAHVRTPWIRGTGPLR
ncbi:hypothetical protein ACFXO2_24750 [Streptomyces sp. NPDC059152]